MGKVKQRKSYLIFKKYQVAFFGMIECINITQKKYQNIV